MLYKIGFSLIDEKKARDDDYLIVIISDSFLYKREFKEEQDRYILSTETLKRRFEYTDEDITKLLYNWQLDADIIKQDFPYEFHLLKHKEEAWNLLKILKEDKVFNCHPSITFNKENDDKLYMSKLTYHYVITKFFLENNKMELTLKQLEVVTKIHDFNMTWEEYLSEYDF